MIRFNDQMIQEIANELKLDVSLVKSAIATHGHKGLWGVLHALQQHKDMNKTTIKIVSAKPLVTFIKPKTVKIK